MPLILEIGNTTQTPNLKKYSFLILSQFVEASELTRKSLWESGGPKFLVNLLLRDELIFINKTIDSLAVWLELEPNLIDKILMEAEVISKLVDIFTRANPVTMEQVLPAYK